MSKKYWNLARQTRERRTLFDKIIIRLFPGVINRWASAHLSAAYSAGVIRSRELHDLDAQMKSDLGRPGFLKPGYGDDHGNA